MADQLYVSTDSKGVEQTPEGDVYWNLPSSAKATTASSGRTLSLRAPTCLLEVLNECIFEAKAVDQPTVDSSGLARVDSARLIEQVPWNTELATQFALDCAEHALGDASDVELPDGTPIAAVIEDARRVLEGVSPQSHEHLGLLARTRALRRLRRELGEIGDLAMAAVAEDERRDREILEDPAYLVLAPLSDAVLAAIESLRHHVLPRFFTAGEDELTIRAERDGLSSESPLRVPTLAMTPWGAVAFGGQHVLAYEPSWSSARDAALHARLAVGDREGAEAVKTERAWQARRLFEILEGSPEKS